MYDRNRYFASVLSRELDRWKKEKGKTQGEFANLIPVQENMITRYKKGKAYPSEGVLLRICKELGVESSIFVPQTFEEYFEYDPSFRKCVDSDMKRREDKSLCNAGIDPNFWKYFWSHPDTLRFFPLSFKKSESKKLFLMNCPIGKIWITDDDLKLVAELQKEINECFSIVLLKKALPRFTNSSEDTPLFPMLENLAKALIRDEEKEDSDGND